MKRRLFNLLAGLSLLLLVATAYLMWRSWIVRDEISISRQILFIVASDSGRIEFACATCSTGIPAPIGGGMGLIKGIPTVYSQQLELRHKWMLPGSGDMTLDHVGLQTGSYYYYGRLLYGCSMELGVSPLVNDVTAVTIPTGVLLFLLAVTPTAWLLNNWFRRRRDRPAGV